MKIQYFIFNYAYFENALRLYHEFSKYGDTYLLNCASPVDPEFDETDKILKLPNIYYSGQWNEALKLLDADVMFITNADVRITSVSRLVHKMTSFYEKYSRKAGLYAPNVNWTPWTFNPETLEDIGGGLKKVVATDSVIWSLTAEMARKVGTIDLNINKLGWGIELLAAWFCSIHKKLVVRDYSIRCQHPQHTAYDRGVADHEWRNMIHQMGIGKDFWDFYETRLVYGFGWEGDDNPIKYNTNFIKMML